MKPDDELIVVRNLEIVLTDWHSKENHLPEQDDERSRHLPVIEITLFTVGVEAVSSRFCAFRHPS
jgi:hypothetical protein